MLILSIVNIIDFLRTFFFLVTILISHCVCKYRARRYRIRRLNGEEINNANFRFGRDSLIREIEQYYRRQELNRESVRMIRKKFKVVKLT